MVYQYIMVKNERSDQGIMVYQYIMVKNERSRHNGVSIHDGKTFHLIYRILHQEKAINKGQGPRRVIFGPVKSQNMI